MQSIALIDYGSGNLRSAEKALLKASADVKPGVVGIIVSRSDAYRRYEAAPDPDSPG